MRLEIVDVSPALAAEWLASKGPNRGLRRSVVDTYAQDMADGKWRFTHQGIAFDERGRLSDGQHRLAAVVRSGVTVTMVVAHGISDEAQLDMDRHAKRSVSDCIQIAHGVIVHKTVVSVANAMRRGMGQKGGSTAKVRPMTAEQTVRWLDEHGEAVRFAAGLLGNNKTRGLSQSSIGAVMARAFYRDDPRRIEAFYRMVVNPALIKDSDEPGASAAVLLNQYLIGSVGVSGTGPVGTVYRKSARALYAFLAKQPLSKIYETKRELFPLPGEDTAEAPEAV